MKEIDFECADQITCPYCGYEESDSWKFSDDGDIECESCGSDYTYTRNTTISYTSYKD